MADPRFYKKKGSFTLAALAEIGQCTIERGDPSLVIEDVAALDRATSTSISLLHNQKYKEALQQTKAAACILAADIAEQAPPHVALLISKYPHRSYALIANAFYPQEQETGDIAPSAVIHPTATLGKGVVVGPLAVIGEGVVIGDYSVIESHVSLSHALVGKHVHIKPGARIGQKGFGFFMDQGGAGGHVSVPQLGRVIIHDYVEIGSNTTIDRGSTHDTVIGEGTRIDNLVQVAHNVEFGKWCVMVAQVGIAGSTKFGDYVAAGGQVGITEHLTIGSGARLAAQCGIMRDVKPGEVLMGSPAMPLKTFYRQIAVLKKLEEQTRKKK